MPSKGARRRRHAAAGSRTGAFKALRGSQQFHWDGTALTAQVKKGMLSDVRIP